ncbi:MAG: Flp pilus assembly complex ATPase component TadA, partial [Fibrobacteres bacterium]|nr:Flp pilus assembly complex ATPase component TadA [Fibrobacterota bacterium]
IDKALQQQKKVRKKIGELLVEMNALKEVDLLSTLSHQIGVALADKESLFSPNADMVRLIPEPFAREYGVLPLSKKDNGLEVAMKDPENITIVDNLRKLVQCEVLPLLASHIDLEQAIKRAYDAQTKSGEVDTVLSGLDFEMPSEDLTNGLDMEEFKKDIEDAPIVKLVNIILHEALKERATDIHIEPGQKEIKVRYRVDGALQEIMNAPLKSHSGVVSRIKILSKLNIAESRLPQDGRFTIKLPDREVDVRVSILPTVLGEKIVMRLLDKMTFNYKLANLGFEDHDRVLFEKAINTPYGIVIIAGPTGSGKSTTLYSALQEILSTEDNIITVEDPVEYQINGISQVAVNEKVGLTFGTTLRSVLRQDPDKILIGEIRDHETADIAMKFALTGHLVFTTLHANDTVSTITRLIDIGVQPFLVGSSVVMVMAQRLVRKICPDCKAPYTPTDKELLLLNLRGEDLKKPLYAGKGCGKCRKTGYFGRIGIFEVMAVSKEIRQVIFDNGDQEKIRAVALAQHMKTLRVSALEKLFAGVTTVKEVLNNTVEEF